MDAWGFVSGSACRLHGWPFQHGEPRDHQLSVTAWLAACDQAKWDSGDLRWLDWTIRPKVAPCREAQCPAERCGVVLHLAARYQAAQCLAEHCRVGHFQMRRCRAVRFPVERCRAAQCPARDSPAKISRTCEYSLLVGLCEPIIHRYRSCLCRLVLERLYTSACLLMATNPSRTKISQPAAAASQSKPM